MTADVEATPYKERAACVLADAALADGRLRRTRRYGDREGCGLSAEGAVVFKPLSIAPRIAGQRRETTAILHWLSSTLIGHTSLLGVISVDFYGAPWDARKSKKYKAVTKNLGANRPLKAKGFLARSPKRMALQKRNPLGRAAALL